MQFETAKYNINPKKISTKKSYFWLIYLNFKIKDLWRRRGAHQGGVALVRAEITGELLMGEKRG